MRKIRKDNEDEYADDMWKDSLRLGLYTLLVPVVAIFLIVLDECLI